MKNLLNKTILRDLQDYKITHRENGHIIYLPCDNLQAFLKRQASKTHHYIFESPGHRKAARICRIADKIAIATAIMGTFFFVYNILNS